MTERYWIYKDSFLRGPYRVGELAKMAEFSENLLVCQDGDDRWLPVIQVYAFQPFLSNRTSRGQVVSTGDYQQDPAQDSFKA